MRHVCARVHVQHMLSCVSMCLKYVCGTWHGSGTCVLQACAPTEGSLARLLRLAVPTRLCQTDTEQRLCDRAPQRQALLTRSASTWQHRSTYSLAPWLKQDVTTQPTGLSGGTLTSHRDTQPASGRAGLELRISIRPRLPPGSCLSRWQGWLPLQQPTAPLPPRLAAPKLLAQGRAHILGSTDVSANPAPPLPMRVTLASYISLGCRLLIKKKKLRLVSCPAHSE